jgi:hypothetical protein
MNRRLLSVTVSSALLLCFAACQTANRTQDGQNKAQSSDSSSKKEPAKWPPLPKDILSPYSINTAQLARVGAGDSLALPLASGFQTLTVTAPLKDGALGIKDLKLKTKDLEGGVINLVIKTLHTHDVKGDEASFVYDNLTAQPEDGIAMDLAGAFEAGKLVGYKYNVAALEVIKPGNKIAVVDEEGWRAVKVKAPLRDGVLAIESFKVANRSEPVANLRAFDVKEGKVGLIRQ